MIALQLAEIGLPLNDRNSQSLHSFKRHYKSILINNIIYISVSSISIKVLSLVLYVHVFF